MGGNFYNDRFLVQVYLVFYSWRVGAATKPRPFYTQLAIRV